MFDLNLSLFDILMFLIIASLDILYYWGKKKDKRVHPLKYIIPTIIVGMVVFLTIKDVIQDIIAIISIGLLSVFFMYTFQAKSLVDSSKIQQSSKTFLKKKSWHKKSLETNDIDFDGINTYIENVEIKEDKSNDMDDFDEIIDEIFSKEQRDEK